MSVLAFFRSVRLLTGGAAGRMIALASVLVAGFAIGSPALAASAGASGLMPTGIQAKPGSQMLLESDQLQYDYDNETVSALGNVKIYYNGYTLESDKVTYMKKTGRLIATGRVKLTDPTGAQVYANSIDITDTFSTGFLDSLRVDTPQNTHFAAESAQRGDNKTTFNNGVYTACEPCKDNPNKPPLWQVKATTIVIDHTTHMMYFRNARMEMFGLPIAYFPYFSTPDPTVKRKSGFLAPIFYWSQPLGVGVGLPYFWNLAPNYDLTLTPVYFSQQGFLGEAEWRHRLDNGTYTLAMAGIDQQDPQAFLIGSSGTFSQDQFRGGIRTTGEFYLNKYWTFGWDGTMSTDREFTRNYGVLNHDDSETISSVYLTGLKDRNYFDARAQYFQILADTPFTSTDPLDGNNQYQQARQAIVTPVIDHNYIFPNPVLGGQLSLNSNLTYLTRDESDPFKVGDDPTVYYHGLAGQFGRATTEADWSKKSILPMGQVLTTFASLRGDAFYIDPTQGAPAILTDSSSATRFMPAVGAEWSLPILANIGSTSHIIEPIAQLIVRPNEPDSGKLPNEDAQSLVFDDSNLFDVDKFSGLDRVEGGTRLNAGIHYLGTITDTFSIDALFGESFQLAGENPFAQPNIADTGAFSGLQTADSDYVGHLQFNVGQTFQLLGRARFDQADFSINRGEVSAANNTGPITTSASYLYVRENPQQGLTTPLSEVSGNVNFQLFNNWRAFGSVAYDLTTAQVFKDTIGIAFENECLTLSVDYSQSGTETDQPDQKLEFHIVFRTLGEQSFSADVSGLGGSSSSTTN